MNAILPLVLNDVCVRRKGKTLLGPINLTLAPKGRTMILGPNGSGKTTLLRVMHGVERLSGGTAQWATSQDDAQRTQGYVFQTPILLRRSVFDNLQYPLKLIGMPRKTREAAARDWIARIGLDAASTLPANRLSGGERQKLAIARALIRDPQVLFLDEPCASLDGRSTREIEGILLDANKKGTRIIMTTHNIGQAKRLATDALFMLGGLVHEAGPADRFFDAPQTPQLNAFFKGDIIE